MEEIVVLAVDRVITCCLDPKGENTFADIYQDDFEGTLKKFQHFKQRMVENEKFPICADCIQTRKNYYNEFHKIKPSAQEIESFLAANAVPRQLVIELTVACNMTCKACISGKRQIKNYRNIENGLFLDTKILKKWLSPYIHLVDSIRLFNYGETFLHPGAIEFCDFLTSSNPGVRLIIATNILPLDNNRKIKDLIKTQPNALFVSLHGASQDSVSRYMGPGANFSRAIKIMKDHEKNHGEENYNKKIIPREVHDARNSFVNRNTDIFLQKTKINLTNYEALIVRQTLHHMLKYYSAISEFFRVCKRGGYVLIIDEPFSPPDVNDLLLKSLPGRFVVYQGLEFKQIREKLKIPHTPTSPKVKDMDIRLLETNACYIQPDRRGPEIFLTDKYHAFSLLNCILAIRFHTEKIKLYWPKETAWIDESGEVVRFCHGPNPNYNKFLLDKLTRNYPVRFIINLYLNRKEEI